MQVTVNYLIISESISNGCEKLSKPVFMDQSYIVFIKAPKSILDYILRICSLKSVI